VVLRAIRGVARPGKPFRLALGFAPCGSSRKSHAARDANRADHPHWFAREGFPRGELGRLLALMHEIDHNGLSALLAPLRQR